MAVQLKTRPYCSAGIGDYECFVQGTLADVNEFCWDGDMPAFTDGSAHHVLHPGLAVASIGAFQLGCNGVSKYIRMRLPKDMRQLSGTAEFLAVEVAARHCRAGDKSHIVTDCLTVVQGWLASVWKKG